MKYLKNLTCLAVFPFNDESMKRVIIPIFLTITISLPTIAMENEDQTVESRQINKSQATKRKYSRNDLLELSGEYSPLDAETIDMLKHLKIFKDPKKSKKLKFSCNLNVPSEEILRELEGNDELPEGDDSFEKLKPKVQSYHIYERLGKIPKIEDLDKRYSFKWVEKITRTGIGIILTTVLVAVLALVITQIN